MLFGVGQRREGACHAVETDLAGDEGSDVDVALGDGGEAGGELLGE